MTLSEAIALIARVDAHRAQLGAKMADDGVVSARMLVDALGFTQARARRMIDASLVAQGYGPNCQCNRANCFVATSVGFFRAHVLSLGTDPEIPGGPRVYFVQAGEGGPIKIGTSDKVPDRIAKLQTANPHKLSLLGTVAGDEEIERALHARFASIRLEGEWFRPGRELLDFIAVVNRQSLPAQHITVDYAIEP